MAKEYKCNPFLIMLTVLIAIGSALLLLSSRNNLTQTIAGTILSVMCLGGAIVMFFIKHVLTELGLQTITPFKAVSYFMRWDEINEIHHDHLAITGHRFHIISRDRLKQAIIGPEIWNRRAMMKEILKHLPPDAKVDPKVYEVLEGKTGRSFQLWK